MSIFKRRTPPQAEPVFPLDRFEPVIRCSICTGEEVACMRDRTTGKLHEVSLLRSQQDLLDFCGKIGVEAASVRKVY